MEKVYKNIRIRDRSCKIQSLGGKRIQELFSLHSLNFRSFVDEYNRCSIFRNVLGRNVDVDRLCAKRTSEGRGKENRYLAVEGIGRHICSPRNEGSLTCRQTTRRAFRFPLSLSLSSLPSSCASVSSVLFRRGDQHCYGSASRLVFSFPRLRGPFQSIASRVSFVFPSLLSFFFLSLLFTSRRNTAERMENWSRVQISVFLARPSRTRNYKEALVTGY